MKRDYDELLKAGNAAQIEKLEQNEHKDGFGDIDIKYAYKRIKQETCELWKEIYLKPLLKMLSFMFPKHYENHRAIRHEASDIANFAHMIILSCNKVLGI